MKKKPMAFLQIWFIFPSLQIINMRPHVKKWKQSVISDPVDEHVMNNLE